MELNRGLSDEMDDYYTHTENHKTLILIQTNECINKRPGSILGSVRDWIKKFVFSVGI